MKRREAQFQILFKHWRNAQSPEQVSKIYELKRTVGESVPFSAVADHQLEALIQVENKGLYYKAPDDSIGYKPVDCFYIVGKGYVVLAFGKTIKEFFIIPVNAWVRESRISDRKSITRDRARVIGETIVVGK